MNKRRPVILALLTTTIALSMAATACGSSSKAAPTTVAGAAGSTSSTTVVFTGDKNSAYCKLSVQISALDWGTPAAEKASIASEMSLITQLSAAAPKELKADIAVFAKLLPQFDAVLKKYGYDESALATTPNAADLKAWKEVVAGTQSGTASARLTAYDTQVCGIDNSVTTSS